jgi:hypothetical protein
VNKRPERSDTVYSFTHSSLIRRTSPALRE